MDGKLYCFQSSIGLNREILSPCIFILCKSYLVKAEIRRENFENVKLGRPSSIVAIDLILIGYTSRVTVVIKGKKNVLQQFYSISIQRRINFENSHLFFQKYWKPLCNYQSMKSFWLHNCQSQQIFWVESRVSVYCE